MQENPTKHYSQMKKEKLDWFCTHYKIAFGAKELQLGTKIFSFGNLVGFMATIRKLYHCKQLEKKCFLLSLEYLSAWCNLNLSL